MLFLLAMSVSTGQNVKIQYGPVRQQPYLSAPPRYENIGGQAMALMIPSDIKQFNTSGEGVFYNFLKSYAKPDNRYIAWYTPEINDNEPDFILFSPDLGLIIFEVKDWVIDQIEEADAEHFSIINGNRVEKRLNPYKQAKRCLNALMDKIKGDKRLVSSGPGHYGKPKVPLNRG